MADDDDDQPQVDRSGDRPQADRARDDKLLVLPLGEESKLITQTIANDTARQILELLAEGALSTSAIAKKLDIPLTTAQYNVERLIEAALVVVEQTKYSEKGREVKLYAPAKRMIVLVPANTPRHAVMDVLKRYLVLVPVAGFVALLVELAMQFGNGPMAGSLQKSAGDSAPLTATGTNLSSFGNPTAEAAGWLSGTPSPLPTHAPVPTTAPPAPGIYGDMNGTVDSVVRNGANMTGNLTGPDVGTAINEAAKSGNAALPPATPSGAGHALLPPDLLNHWGLWFFVGCLLIIGILMAYDLYRSRSKK